MEEKYIDLLLKKCIYSKVKSKSLFISYDIVNKDFIDKLIKEARKIGYDDILIEERDIIFEHKLLNNLTEEEIMNHNYFNNPVWKKAAEEKYIFLMVSTKFPGYLDDIPNSKLIAAEESRSIARREYMSKVAEDSISWTIFALPNIYWANSLYPNDIEAYSKLENLIYSFCMLDTNDNNFENYIHIENIKVDYLNNLNIKKLKLINDLGTDLSIELVDNYVFKSLQENHCIENLPTYAVWSAPHKYRTNGIVYGTIPISIGNYLISDYWFLFKDGKVIDYDARSGKDYLKQFFQKDDNHKRLGEISIIDSNSPIAKTKISYSCNLFDENISTHLALGMAYKNNIKNGENMTDEELDKNGVNVCSDHLDFTIGSDSLRIIAITRDNDEIEIYKNGNFNYELINEESPFESNIQKKYK